MRPIQVHGPVRRAARWVYPPPIYFPEAACFVPVGREFAKYRRLYESLEISAFNDGWQTKKQILKAICPGAYEMTELEKESAHLGLRYQL